MKSERLLDALGKIDDELILEAAPGNKPSKKNSKRMLWIKWGTMAACAVVIVESILLGYGMAALAAVPANALQGLVGMVTAAALAKTVLHRRALV